MGKEQGDHLPSEPTVMVIDDGDGGQLERSVYTRADEVQARAEGWELKGQQGGKPAGRRSSGSRRDSGGEAASTPGKTD